jgi:hypothetical protein
LTTSKIFTLRRILTGLGTLLEKISKFQPKIVGYWELNMHTQGFNEGLSKTLTQMTESISL